MLRELRPAYLSYEGGRGVPLPITCPASDSIARAGLDHAEVVQAMAWATSDRRSRLPANWHALRAQALARDDYQCVALVREEGRRARRCDEVATDVDHRIRGDDHRIENLQSLCRVHHDAKTQTEAGEARSAKWSDIHKRLRPPQEEHPAAAYARTHGSETLVPGLLARRAPSG